MKLGFCYLETKETEQKQSLVNGLGKPTGLRLTEDDETNRNWISIYRVLMSTEVFKFMCDRSEANTCLREFLSPACMSITGGQCGASWRGGSV